MLDRWVKGRVVSKGKGGFGVWLGAKLSEGAKLTSKDLVLCGCCCETLAVETLISFATLFSTEHFSLFYLSLHTHVG